MQPGFLNSAAPLGADVTLVLELGMGTLLLIGAWLARRRRFDLHAKCQAAVVLLNLALIATAMAPPFRALVVPGLPAKLGRHFYALAAAHAVLGTAAQCMGVYIFLAAGTKLLPANLRLTRYKLWMRTLLALWWIVLALGVATYTAWYHPHWIP